MAYNSYYPATYQPMYPQMPQPVLPQPAQPSGTIWVNGPREAEVYPVAPNNSVTLWDSTSPTIYKKTAGADGRPVLTVYDLVERAPSPAKEPTAYATKDDLAALSSAVDALESELKAMKAVSDR